MSWLNKSLSQLTDVTSSISKFTEDVLAAEPPPVGEDDNTQLAEYQRQLDYYKKELEKAINGSSGSMEAKIEINDLQRQVENSKIRIDELRIQLANTDEELQDSINELNKVSKRNSLLSKQNYKLDSRNNEFKLENESLQKTLEEIDLVHQDELQELIKQRDALKKHVNNLQSEVSLDDESDVVRKLKAENEKIKLQLSERTPSPTESSLSQLSPSIKQKMAKLQKNLKAKIEELEKSLAAAETENNKMRKELECSQAFASKVENTNQVILQLEINKAESDAKLKEFHKSVEEKLRIVEEYKNVNTELNSKIEERALRFLSLTKEKQTVDACLAEERKKVHDLEGKLSHNELPVCGSNDDTANVVQELNNEISDLKAKNVQITNIMEESKKQGEILAHQLQTLELKTRNQCPEEVSNGLKIEIQVLGEKLDVSEKAIQIISSDKAELSSKMLQMIECVRLAEEKTALTSLELTNMIKEKEEISSQLNEDQMHNEREVNNLESIIQQLQRDNRTLTALLESNTAETDVQLATIMKLKSELEEARGSLRNNQSRLSEVVGYQTMIQDLEEVNAINIDKIKNMSIEKDRVVRDIEAQLINSQEALQRSATHLKQLQDNTNLLESTLTELRLENEILKKAGGTLPTDISDKPMRHEDMECIKAENSELMIEIEALKENHRTTVSELEINFEKSNAEKLDSFTDKLSNLEEQLTLSNETNYELKLKLEALGAAADRVALLEKEIDDSVSTISELKGQLTDQNSLISELAGKNDEIEALRNEVREKLNADKGEINQPTKQVSDYKTILKSATENVEEPVTKQEKTELAELRKTLEQKDEKIKEAYEQIEDLKEDAEGAQSLFEQLKALEKQYTISQKNYTQLREKYDYHQLSSNVDKHKLEEKEKIIERLMKGRDELQKSIHSMEMKQPRLQAITVNGDKSNELQNHVAQLTSHIQQRESQLQLSLKQNDNLKAELQQMHLRAQENIGSQVQEEQLAHLEAEKEQLHSALNKKNKEMREISNRLQETGSLLRVKTEQLDNLATDLEEARHVKEKAQMRTEAMSKLSHLIRSKDVELEALKAKNDSLMEILRSNDQMAELSVRFEQLITEKENGQQQIRELGEKIVSMEGMLTQAENGLDLVREEFIQYQKHIDAVQETYTNALRACDVSEERAENDELSIATLNLLLKKIKEKAAVVGSSGRGIPDGCPDMSSNTSTSFVKPSDWTTERAELMQSSVRNLKERCSSLEAKNTAMKRDNDALRDQLMDRREKWDTMEINNESLGKELSLKDEVLTNLKIELAEVRAKLVNSERDVRECSLLRQRLIDVESEYEEEITNIRTNEEKLHHQVATLRDGIDNIAGSKNELEERQQEYLREQKKRIIQLNKEAEASRKRERAFELNVRELQEFIEHFRQQQEFSIEERERTHAAQIQRADREKTGLRDEVVQLRGRMETAEIKAARSDELQAEIDASEGKFVRLRCVIDEKAIELDTIRRRLMEATDAAGKSVDKDLAKNIVLKYLSLPATNKVQGIQILRAVFDFTEEEANQAVYSSIGWRGWFQSKPPNLPISEPGKSFSELFVNFLEAESSQSETIAPALPANRLVADIGRSQRDIVSTRNKGIEGRNYEMLLNGPVIPSSKRHQNALLQGLLDD